jgi:DNA-binding FadR family transcriptional regulator
MALLNPTRAVETATSLPTTLLAATRIGRHVRVPKTAELVAAHLRRQIVRGELVEGDALPPEAVLMEQFGVSRPTLREAFRVLESEALISVRRGAHGGARVHTPGGDVAARYAGLVLEHRGTTLADLLTARTLLEPPAIGLLATHHTETDLTLIRTTVTDPQPATTAQFHALLVELAGNQTLTVLHAILSHIIDLAVTGANPNGPADAHWCEPAATDAHARIVELIADRDAAGAEALWRRHLDNDEQLRATEHDPHSVIDLLG